MPSGTSSQTSSVHIEAVHRLSDLGAVVTAGATWDLAGGLRCRVASDRHFRLSKATGSAGARSSTRQTSTPRSPALTNYSRRRRDWKTRQAKCSERFQAYFATRDWDAIADMLTADLYSDDRRPVVGGGIRPGRDAIDRKTCGRSPTSRSRIRHQIVIATRGGRLALARTPSSRGHGEPDPFHVDFLSSSRSTPTIGSQRSSRSTPTTSTLPSRNSTPATSPAKLPPTRTRGRPSRGNAPRSTDTKSPQRRRTV